MRKIKQTKHGYHKSKIYGLWASMVNRCESQNSGNYKYYGGSGISVCEEWRKNPKAFIEWALSNGYAEGMEIDRKKNSGNYEPSNCQFITHKQNCEAGKRRLNSNNKSGYTGIIKTRFNTYEVYAPLNGRTRYVTTTKTLDDAIQTRKILIGNLTDNPELLK